MRNICSNAVAAAALGLAGPAWTAELPAYKIQPSAYLVVEEHLDALNKCDWDRLMAQYPHEVELFLPNGAVVTGRKAIGEVFTGFCKDRKDGGFKGATFTPEVVHTVGDTINVAWRLEADWLSEPYKGADAYVTQHGLMYVQVTTFDPADMKFKK